MVWMRSSSPRSGTDPLDSCFNFITFCANSPALENVMMPMRIGGRNERRPESGRSSWPELDFPHACITGRGSFPAENSSGQRSPGRWRWIPKSFLADEPSGNLDLANGEMLHELLVEVVNDLEIGMIVVTTTEGSAARAGRVLLLEGGKLSETIVGEVVV